MEGLNETLQCLCNKAALAQAISSYFLLSILSESMCPFIQKYASNQPKKNSGDYDKGNVVYKEETGVSATDA